MPPFGERQKVPKILNYPPGEGLNPGGLASQQAMEAAMRTGAQVLAQQNQAAANKKKEEDKTS